MSMIRVENITFSYPSSFDPVFENVSFQIDTEWKLGLVGRNGRGKTTFAEIFFLDEYEYRGKITGAVTFDYFPYSWFRIQTADDRRYSASGVSAGPKQWQITEENCPTLWKWMSLKCLWRPFETLSNGEQTKVASCGALFERRDIFC